MESADARRQLKSHSHSPTDGRMDGGSARDSARGAMMQTLDNPLKTKVLVIATHKETQVVRPAAWLDGWMAGLAGGGSGKATPRQGRVRRSRECARVYTTSSGGNVGHSPGGDQGEIMRWWLSGGSRKTK